MPAIEPIRRLTWRQTMLALLGLVLLWPAALNGGAFFFPDSSTYIRGIDAAVFHATGHRTAWTNDEVERIAAPPAAAAASPGAGAAPVEPEPVLLGRSPFYGVLPYLGAMLGSFWITVAIQALMAGVALLGIVRHIIDPSDPRRFARATVILFAVTAVTPLPFFASMLMPDFLTGLGALAAAALAIGWARERWVGRAGWFALAGYAALAHASHVLILAGLGGSAALIAVWRRDPAIGRGAVAIVLAAGLGMTGEAAFARAVAVMTGRPAIRPPFLTARLQEDGPATAFLRDTCPTGSWLLCRYRARLPLGSDSFLWSADPRTGVFSTIDPAQRRALAGEQMRFVRAVALDRPGAVIRSTTVAVGRQFRRLGLVEFDLDPQGRDNIAAQLPPAEQARFLHSGAVMQRIPTVPFGIFLTLAMPLAMLAVIAASLMRRARRATLVGWVVIAGWMLNNLVCGAMSTPHERYQARIAWAVIAAGALVLIRLALDRRADGYRAEEARLDAV